MRLLSRHNGRLQFSPFGPPREPYAILSHRWLSEDDEVSHTDVLNDNLSKPGYEKIEFCLNQAEKDGYKHVWIDSCCIKRSSSAELAEAINSMFKWYRQAAICYVYLQDISYEDRDCLGKSVWFKRGWTLQELVAPDDVHFFSSDRQYLGDKKTLHQTISAATTIGSLDASIPERFSWSFGRETTKPEDASYCMVGLLGVTMTPQYGESAEEAQDRLFETIERKYGRPTVREIWRRITLQAVSVLAGPAAPETTIDCDELLKSLSYENLNTRRGAIENPFTGTCAWLLENKLYCNWLSMKHNRFLWIKGKPGAGKSTLIKFADLSAVDCFSISFYFSARGTELERSTTGMYRSLLFQLLQREPTLRPVVLERLRNEMIYTGRFNLTLPSLQNAVKEAANELKQPIRCFIDALDECADGEAQDMLSYLQDLSKQAPLYICIASRHYPTVYMNAPEILLERQQEHEKDVRDYVHGRLLAKDDFKQQVVKKAKGVFLWAVLVVKQLNEALADGSKYAMQQTLERVPGELMSLLENIAARSDNLLRFRISMHWLLCGKPPLNIATFFIGVLLGLSEAGADDLTESMEAALKGDTKPEEMKACVTAWSRGLAEPLTTQYGPKIHVQVIHESVRNFFSLEQGRRLLVSDPQIDIACQMHDTIKRACRRYMGLRASAFADYRYTHAYAFSDYVHDNILWHADVAAKVINQDNFIGTFDMGLYNRMLLRLSPCDSIWFSFVHHGTAALVPIAKRLGLDPDLVKDEKGRTPLSAAVVDDRHEVVRALLTCNADRETSDQCGRTALHLAVAAGSSTTMIQTLFDHGACASTRASNGWTLLHTAIAASLITVHLGGKRVEYTPSMQPEDLEHVSLATIGLLSDEKHEITKTGTHVLELLLAQRPDLTARDSSGKTVLMFAALTGSQKTLDLMLNAGADIEMKDELGMTALIQASAAGRVRSVRRLLSANANTQARDLDNNTALLAACKHHKFEMAHGHAEAAVEMHRLSHGASDYFEDIDTRIFGAVHSCDIDIVKLLLDNGAEPNAVDWQGSTSLSVVCARPGGLAIAECLLNKGADPNITDRFGRTALATALDCGRDEIAAFLISRGADLHITDSAGLSAMTLLQRRTV